jgi:hypothetical protein
MPYFVNSCNGGSSRGGEDHEAVRVGRQSRLRGRLTTMAASERSDFSLLLWRLTTTPRMPAQCNERDIMAPQARAATDAHSAQGDWARLLTTTNCLMRVGAEL